ncbi:MAG: hypothetical protein ACI4O0_04995, partial [Candidatus Limivicinus sp.]
MKTKRFVSTLLALLLICSLPVSAFADARENTGPMENNDSPLDVNTSTGTITNNNNNVILNFGSITNNCEGGKVDKNHGAVCTNDGEIVDNGTSDIPDRFGTVDINNGKVGCNSDLSTVTTNNGTVSTNAGTVTDNYKTVDNNYGTVETNTITGVVTNKSNKFIHGTVGTNYGTVNEADGTTHYGIQVDNDGDVSLEQKQAGDVLDFSQFTKEGYVYAGYTQEYQLLDGVLTKQAITVNDTSYTADCPNVLTLIWQAIASPVTDDGAGSFGPGSYISVNGHKFLLVAVVEDVYCLASVDSFEDEALSDLPALLSSLLTEEQLTHVTGEPELLDEALTARFFAGQGSHIV